MSSLARKIDYFHVTTVIEGEVKSQKWSTNKILHLPQPLGGEIQYAEGQLIHKSSEGAKTPFSMGKNSRLEIPIEGYRNSKLVLHRLRWGGSEYQTEGSISKVTTYLSMMVISGHEHLGTHAASLQKEMDLLDETGHRVLQISESAHRSGVNFSAMSQDVVMVKGGNKYPIAPGRPVMVPTAELDSVKVIWNGHWWKFRPIMNAFHLEQDAKDLGEERLKYLSFFAVGLFFLGTMVNLIVGPSKVEVARTVESPTLVDAAQTVALPKAIEEDLKIRKETEKKQLQEKLKEKVAKPSNAPIGLDPNKKFGANAVVGDGKLPPGGQKDGPLAPAAALGNGFAPAENGGTQGTMKGDPKKAAALPSTHKVHVPKNAAPPKDLIATKAPIRAMGITSKAGTGTSIIALEQNQAQKLLAKKSAALENAFASVAGLLSGSEGSGDPLAQTGGDGPAKSGGLVAPNGHGAGDPNAAKVLLGQTGSAYGKGIVGGTGGSPNGVVGGYGLSTRYKGTGTKEGAGVGGIPGGSLFVDLDAKTEGGGFSGAISEGLTKDEVGRVIHQHSAEVRECYESALAKSPGLKGRVLVDFVIGANGMIKTAQLSENQTGSAPLPQCVISHLKSWKFPNPRNGVDVSVSYPFTFRTLGE